MKNFMMLFHSVEDLDHVRTPEQTQALISEWENWMGSISHLGTIKGAEELGHQGRTLHSDGSVTDGPYTELKEIVGGYLICTTADIDTAMQMAAGCPVLEGGGKVEVREIIDFEISK